jgi:hypothetical protein
VFLEGQIDWRHLLGVAGINGTRDCEDNGCERQHYYGIGI